MTGIAENGIEELAIELLDKLGFEYIYAPNIAPNGETPEKETYEQVLLLDRLQDNVKPLNDKIMTKTLNPHSYNFARYLIA